MCFRCSHTPNIFRRLKVGILRNYREPGDHSPLTIHQPAYAKASAVRCRRAKKKNSRLESPEGQYLLLHDYEKNRNCILKNELDVLDFKNGSSKKVYQNRPGSSVQARRSGHRLS